MSLLALSVGAWSAIVLAAAFLFAISLGSPPPWDG